MTLASLAAPNDSQSATPSSTEFGAVACASLNTPLYQTDDPKTGRTLLTTSEQESLNSPRFGFTHNRGATMKISQHSDIPGLAPVHRVFNSRTFAWAAETDLGTVLANGFTDGGVSFYAAPQAESCTRPVFELTKQGYHRYTTSQEEVDAYTKLGWKNLDSPFFVAAEPTPYGHSTTVGATEIVDHSPVSAFSFAVIPDTQLETHSDDDHRLANRSQWLVANRESLDLRFAVQVGDLVDWDTPYHDQYQRASLDLQPLQDAHLPYFLNIGNHDSQATCQGGGACDYRFTKSLQRMTQVFNQYFPASRFGAKVGEFEPSKVDNTYTTIAAGGDKWILLNLELWPRRTVIEWAARIIRQHPHYNIIIATHAFLDAQEQIDAAPNYGSTTSQYLFDKLISPYANVKMVLCGHVGTETTKVLTGKHGNKIFVFLQAFHSTTTNPVRLIRVDAAKQTLTTWIVAPATNEQLLAPVTYSSVGLVR